jgi:hypothetical protein
MIMANAYVPSTIGEVRELVGAMVLCMPDMELPNTALGLDGAYQALEHSLGLIRSRLGDEKHDRLIDMARESKQLFVDGRNRDGRFILQDMHKLLRGRA